MRPGQGGWVYAQSFSAKISKKVGGGRPRKSGLGQLTTEDTDDEDGMLTHMMQIKDTVNADKPFYCADPKIQRMLSAKIAFVYALEAFETAAGAVQEQQRTSSSSSSSSRTSCTNRNRTVSVEKRPEVRPLCVYDVM